MNIGYASVTLSVFLIQARLSAALLSGPKRSEITAFIVALAVLSLTIVLIIKTNIIRESGTNLCHRKYRYDLGRFLTLFWGVIIATCYFCIWLITGSTELPGTALALTVFSSTVALLGHLTSAGPHNEYPAVSMSNSRCRNFWTDVLSDSSGCSLHRFQLLLWNLLFGMMFVAVTWEHFALPHFSNSLIELAAISTSIHLGFELLDRKHLHWAQRS